MKIRTGFVSNSSSSSFTCNVCGYSERAWEPPDGFKYCLEGHGLCENCYNIDKKIVEEIASLPFDEMADRLGLYEVGILKESKDLVSLVWDLIVEAELLEEFCPICRFEVIIDRDIKNYLVKTSNVTTQTVFQHVKSLNKRRKNICKLASYHSATYDCKRLWYFLNR